MLKKMELDAEKQSLSANVNTGDIAKEMQNHFSEIETGIVQSIHKELKFEKLVENEELNFM